MVFVIVCISVMWLGSCGYVVFLLRVWYFFVCLVVSSGC